MITDILYFFNFWSVGLLLCRFFDGYKYHKLSQRIRKIKSAKGHSRDAGNIALGVDIFMLGYFIFKNFDLYMIISTIIIIGFVLEYWFTVYWFYPYRMRGCPNFKRPDLWAYLLNSIQSDKYRKRL